jgi:hypothetical protein
VPRKTAIIVCLLGLAACDSAPPPETVPLEVAVDAFTVDHARTGNAGPGATAPAGAPRFVADGQDFVVRTAPDAAPAPGRYEARVNRATGEVFVKREDAAAGLTIRPVSGLPALRPAAPRGTSIVFTAPPDLALVHTPQSNGLKEDIVLTRPRDTMTLEWELVLGPDLEARRDESGQINVYGPSSVLSGNIQVGDEETRALLDNARRRARRDELLYRIPKPVIRQASGVEVPGTFELEGTRLRLVATGLRPLNYPISIDPSVLVTTTPDFQNGGTNEHGVNLTGDQLKRQRTRVRTGSQCRTG